MNAPVDTMPDRTTFIGGSDVGAILGVSPWKTAFQLYQEKIGEYVEPSDPERDKRLNRGKRWEPIVIEMLVDELESRGHTVEIIGRNARYIDPEFPFMSCEIDLELLIDKKEEVNSEMKTVHPFSAKDWGEQGTDDFPVYYSAQAMHGLMIKPRRRCIVAALIGADDLRVHEIFRDEGTIAGMRKKEIEFWERVQTRNPPPITDAKDVKRMYIHDAGTVAVADEGLAMVCRDLKDMKVSAKNLKSDIETLETSLKLRMGDAATLLYGDSPLATWKTQSARDIDIKALEMAHPELVSKYRIIKESRVLRLK